MKKSNLALVVLLLILLAGAAAFLLSRGQSEFTGNCVKNSDAYLLDIGQMNGTDSHTMKLAAGDVLLVRFETTRGTLQLEIKSPDGAVIYAGNGKDVAEFTLNIPADGVYTMTVEAQRASGVLEIVLQ